MGWRDAVGEKENGDYQDETPLVFSDANAMIWYAHKATHEI
jgi:hypothetical protein